MVDYKYIKKAELTESNHKMLIKFSKNKIQFLTSVFNVRDIGWLKKIKFKIFKNS